MSSIGPQLPPHLQKRKRTPEDEAELGSPPPKTSRRHNEDEISLDDESDDGYGPTAPVSANNTAPAQRPSRPAPAIGPSLPPTVNSKPASPAADKKRSIGPSLPPTTAPTNDDEIPLDSDSDDAAGPAPPTKTGPAPPPKRVLGPAPPPAPLSERPPTDPDSSSDDEDDWGPSLPGSSSASRAAAAAATAAALSSASRAEPAAPKRDDWMLAPPTSSGYRAPDPTKLKSRKFASGPRAATEGKPGGGVSSIWTETPEEKARRLANAVLGREDPNNPHPQQSAAAGPRPDARAGQDDARIRSYTEQTRGKSLVEQHQAARAAGKKSSSSTSSAPGKGDSARWGSKAGAATGGDDEDEDDPSKRAFDWEKDMKVGGQISGAQRKELLNRAANFGGRFQSGKYL